MREFAAAGGGGDEAKTSFFFLRSRQARLQVSRERESLAQRGGGHRGHKAKKKEKENRRRIKSPFQSSQTASDPPSGKGATSLLKRAPLVSLSLRSCFCCCWFQKRKRLSTVTPLIEIISSRFKFPLRIFFSKK